MRYHSIFVYLPTEFGEIGVPLSSRLNCFKHVSDCARLFRSPSESICRIASIYIEEAFNSGELYSRAWFKYVMRFAFHNRNTPLQNKSHTLVIVAIRLKKSKFYSDGQTFTMQYDPPVATDNANADIWELIQALVLGRVPANRILELFYWGQQPGVLEMVRSILDMRPESRAAIAAFLTAAHAETISMEIERSGRLVLSSPEITDAATILRKIEKADANSEMRALPTRAPNI